MDYERKNKKLAELTPNGTIQPVTQEVEFDRMDYFLSEHERQAKRIHDYIVQQDPILCEYQRLTGFVKFTGREFSGDYMNSDTLTYTREIALKYFYRNPIENLSMFEWEHATADFGKIIRIGVNGLLNDIEKSKAVYKGDEEKTGFLNALESVAFGGKHDVQSHGRSFGGRQLGRVFRNIQVRIFQRY